MEGTNLKTEIFDVSEFGIIDPISKRTNPVTEKAALTAIHHGAAVLRRGGLVAFPTETVYGLGADAMNPEAVRKIYAAKGRPSDNPMIVHIARASDIGQLTPVLTPDMIKLIDSFWPGPLTMVLNKQADVPDVTTGGLSTVAVRLPDDPAAIELIRAAGTPVAAPSANLSGSPSPTKAEHVVHDLSGKVDVILAGADSRIGIESTVIDMTAESPVILRPGLLTADMISAAIEKEVFYDKALLPQHAGLTETIVPKSPGMKYKHYAPKAEMLVVEGRQDRVRAEIERLRLLNEGLGLKVGELLFEEQDYIEAAHGFYGALRRLDEDGVDLILAGALSAKDGLGFAVMNRMMKSAGYNIARV
jgi:L-threonylcarbamoyladenylate synthase